MQTSYNGWTASPNPADFGGLEQLTIAGESFPPGVRRGDVHTLFSRLGQRIHDSVEHVVEPTWHQADDWGYSFRQNRNANNLSCHASGTAIDWNATRHPNGKRGTFNAQQAATTRQICKVEFVGLVRWGGDFTGTADEMHFEIIGTPGQVAKLVSGAGTANLPPANSGPQPWLMLPAVRSRPLDFQRWYNDYPFKPALLPMIKPVANNYGPQSDAALKKVQARYGLVADGIDGPLTKQKLWDLGFGKYVGM